MVSTNSFFYRSPPPPAPIMLEMVQRTNLDVRRLFIKDGGSRLRWGSRYVDLGDFKFFQTLGTLNAFLNTGSIR